MFLPFDRMKKDAGGAAAPGGWHFTQKDCMGDVLFFFFAPPPENSLTKNKKGEKKERHPLRPPGMSWRIYVVGC